MGVQELNEIVFAKWVAQYLAHSNPSMVVATNGMIITIIITVLIIITALYYERKQLI